ncbi:hypothetical protein ES707_22428 [subsurface metagenome]
MRSTGPPIPSGSCSLGGTCTWLTRPAFGVGSGEGGIALVMSLPPTGAATGADAPCVIVICEPPSTLGADELFDCLPSGVGEMIDGAGGTTAGVAFLSAGDSVEAGSSIAGIGGAEPVSSRFIAILKVPSTITTTLAPTSSERIFEVMLEPSVPGVPGAALGLSFALSLTFSFALSAEAALADLCVRLSFCALAAAAWAARRAAAMKLDVLTGSFGPVAAAGISLSASSEAAMRSDGEDIRGLGRVPGSSG